MVNKLKIFISYSSNDTGVKTRLESHLSSLVRQRNEVVVWSDKQLVAGQPFEQEIFQQLFSSNIVLLLVSDHFINSRFCYEKEFDEAIKLASENKLVIVSIILTNCAWQDLPFGKYQVLPDRAKPLDGWERENDGLTAVVNGLKLTVESLIKNLERGFDYRHEEVTTLIADGQFEEAANVLLDLAKDFDKTPEKIFMNECTTVVGMNNRVRKRTKELTGIEPDKLLQQLLKLDHDLAGSVLGILSKIRIYLQPAAA